jgi:hypothetical protein
MTTTTPSVTIPGEAIRAGILIVADHMLIKEKGGPIHDASIVRSFSSGNSVIAPLQDNLGFGSSRAPSADRVLSG